MEIVENYLGDKLFSKKLSSSITYYLWFCFDASQSDEALLEDYLDLSLPYDDEICSHIYLDKQTYKWIIIDLDTLDKVRETFLERVARKRIQMQEQ